MPRVVVVVPDATRSLDYPGVLGPLFARLEGEVTVLVGRGLHRPMTLRELEPLIEVCEHHGARLRQHHPAMRVAAPSGALIAPEIVYADRVVAVGVVEPHQYAGFSGGVKGLIIGCGAYETVAHMHSLEMLAACGARIGWFEGNPFQNELWRLAEGLPPVDGWFVVPGHAGVLSGPVRSAFEDAVAISRSLHFREVDAPVRSMLLRVPPEKGTNFYQASRAATYVALAQSPALVEGGTLYVEAPCPEGIGTGAGELACAAAMKRGRAELLAELRAENPPETSGGAQRAYVLAMALQRAKVALVGSRPIPELEAFGVEQLPLAPPVELTVDDPFHALPILKVH